MTTVEHVGTLGAAPGGGRLRKAVGLMSFSDFWKVLPDLLLASVSVNVLALALPLMLLQVYDRVIPNQALTTMWLLVGGVTCALMLEILIKMGRIYITSWLAARFEHKITCAGLRQLLGANIVDYEDSAPSVHAEHFRSANIVRDFYSGEALLALFDLPFMVGYLVLIWLIGGPLVLVPILLFVLYVASTLFAGRKVSADIRNRNTLDERRYSFISEVMQGIHTVKTMAMEALMQRRYEMLQETNVEQSYHSVTHSLSAVDLGSLFSQLLIVAVVAFGAGLVLDNHMTPGGVAACVLLAARSLQPLRGALSVWMRIQAVAVARQQVEKLFEVPIAENARRPSLPSIDGRLVLDNVTLRYPRAPAAFFGNLSLTVEVGECIAIIGDSGSGKTTLLSLMAGMLAPSHGRILADDFDLAEFAPSSFPRQVALLPQQGVLFQGTLLENLTMFDTSLEATAVEIARDLGLDQVVAGMRNGYETWVGGSVGETLPAGVKQRIAIVRALVHRPKIILFDEANIGIDGGGDELLRQYLEKLKGRCTMVLVTHRPSLLKLADRRYLLIDHTLKSPEEAPSGLTTPFASGAAVGQIADRPDPNVGIAYNLLSRFPVATDLSMCLIGLLTAMEWRGNPRQLVESLPHMRESLDYTGFRRVMANLNYTCRSERTSLRDVDSLALPCLFVPDRGGTAKVLLKEKDGAILAFDGVSLETVELARDRTHGTITIFDERKRTPAEPAARDSWVGGIISRFSKMLWMNFGLTIGITILGLATPIFVMAIYNRAIPAADIKIVPYLVAGVCIALATEWVMRELRGRILAHVGARFEFIVGNAIFQRLLALPIAFTEQVSIGSQLARMKDFEMLREAFVGPIALFLYELPTTLIYVVALAVINGWLFLVMMLAGCAYLALGLMTQAPLAKRMNTAARLTTERQEFLIEFLTRMRAVKLAGAENLWFERYRALSARSLESELYAQRYASLISVIAQALGSLISVAVLVTTVLVSFGGTVGTGAIVVSMILTFRLIGPLQTSFMSLSTMFRVVRSVRQIDNLMRLKVERDPSEPVQAPPVFKGEVLFSRVSFRYSNDADPALLGVSVRVPPGHVAAIAGRNGAGKSTLMKLITGIYQPQAGSVRLDNIDIRQLDPLDLRSVISYAPQRCDIFYGTIAQNLRLVHPNASDEELRWAADLVGLTEDVMSMSRGFDTRISDTQGGQLPHGFRQRLSLARCCLRPAPVILFDEPGNGLDAAGDHAFVNAVGWLRRRSTIFIVSHRPSHLRLADVVIFLEDGYVRQIGSFDQLRELIMGAV